MLGAARSAADGSSLSASGSAAALAGRSWLSMYTEQPDDELTLEDFEVYAFERLKGESVARDPPEAASEPATRGPRPLLARARRRPTTGARACAAPPPPP